MTKRVVNPVIERRDAMDPFIEMEIIDRPASTRAKYHLTRAVEMILQAVAQGKAVRMTLEEGVKNGPPQMALRHELQKRGLRLRYQKSGNAILAWSEPIVK